MLRKRTRSLQKDQQQNKMAHQTVLSDANSDHCAPQFHHGLGHNNNKIFNVPSLFVGLGPKGLLDSDSVRSPTSPLDARVFLSNLGGNNPVRNSTRRSSSHLHDEGNQRSWDCCKVGLGLIDSLEDCSKFSGKILRSSESLKISLSPKMMIKTPNCTQPSMDDDSKSLPKYFTLQKGSSTKAESESSSVVLFEIGESGLENELFGKTRSCSLDSSCRPMKTLSSSLTTSNSETDSSFGLKDPHFIGESSNTGSGSLCSSSNEFIVKSISASEIELSEDYTCVISHGPNPKTTHIFGDYILEETHSSSTEFKNKSFFIKNEEKDNKGVSLVGKRLQNIIPTTQYYPSSDFLSFCHHCNKKLEEGKDIYIYGGEKAFCSLTCRALMIMIDEELEKSKPPPSENSPKLEFGERLFEIGILTCST